jgi:methylamine---corrinoid protein Co-methyltransferase
MTTVSNLLKMVERTYDGPICSQEDWDFRIISKKAKEILTKYNLFRVWDKETPVNCDDELADRFYQAGVELATITGIYSIETERIIQISEEEIADAIANQPAEVHLGLGKEAITVVSRRPEDGQKPICQAIIGSLLSEDLYVDLTAAIVSIPEVDCISGATLTTAYGKEIMAGTPFETAAGYLEAQLKREATTRAGRPGMCVTAAENSPSAFGLLSSFGVPGGFDPKKDIVLILGIAELKIFTELFHKAIHAVQCGGRMRGGQVTMIGGYGGGVEAAIIINIAITVLYRAVFGIEYGCGNLLDVRYMGNCGRAGVWGQSVILQALSRNSNFLPDAIATQVSGSNTEMFMWETAVGVLNHSASGNSVNFGPYTAGGLRTDYLTPLDVKYYAQLGIAGAKMTRQKVNEIAKELLPRYEKNLFNPPIGQSIHECYDVSKMQPHDDWLALYEMACAELVSMGVPLE